jgi:hypothetical protein
LIDLVAEALVVRDGIERENPDLEPVCPRCVESDGLCTAHAKAVLPQLAQPGWVRLIGVTKPKAERRIPDAAAERIRQRKAAKATRRLIMALRGQRTASRRSSE